MKKFFVLLTSSFFLLTTQVLADETLQPLSIAGYIEYETYDDITVVSLDGQNRIVLNITDETIILEFGTNAPMVLTQRENDRILAYYGPITTRSIPPQSNIVMLFLNFDEVVYDVPSDYYEDGYVTGYEDYEEYEYYVEEPILTVPYTPPVMTLVDALASVYAEFYTENYITMVPLRQVAESMGFNVIWDDYNKSVTLQHSDGQAFGTVMLGQDVFEGRSLDATPTIHEGRTFVPVSFFEILLGM